MVGCKCQRHSKTKTNFGERHVHIRRDVECLLNGKVAGYGYKHDTTRRARNARARAESRPLLLEVMGSNPISTKLDADFCFCFCCFRPINSSFSLRLFLLEIRSTNYRRLTPRDPRVVGSQLLSIQPDFPQWHSKREITN